MKIIEVEYSPKFAKMYKKIPMNIKRLAEKKESLFKTNPFDPKLRIHKLSGKLAKYWSFSINYQYRIIFSFVKESHIRFHAVGTHDVYN